MCQSGPLKLRALAQGPGFCGGRSKARPAGCEKEGAALTRGLSAVCSQSCPAVETQKGLPLSPPPSWKDRVHHRTQTTLLPVHVTGRRGVYRGSAVRMGSVRDSSSCSGLCFLGQLTSRRQKDALWALGGPRCCFALRTSWLRRAF